MSFMWSLDHNVRINLIACMFGTSYTVGLTLFPLSFVVWAQQVQLMDYNARRAQRTMRQQHHINNTLASLEA